MKERTRSVTRAVSYSSEETMTKDSTKKALSERDDPMSKAEQNSEANVPLLKLGLLILIIFGILMLTVTGWYMTKQYRA